ncbi:hypothetical protein QNH20_19550 [Neobacillus sp. WH10]|uniref:hypothetical protein n=1 Tax=Neobacillus sp. WH10 TaxID=3047873 RepID=UPI0024C1E8FF|nr:hypothetical protein [Neobacillus sp. WH10]WHY76298.1 hypothetical protein QNH20_19550 [Neobacillus sp. WH10]
MCLNFLFGGINRKVGGNLPQFGGIWTSVNKKDIILPRSGTLFFFRASFTLRLETSA